MHIRVKICCIASVDEQRTAVAAGADAIGLVAQMPSGPGIISEPLIRSIGVGVPPGVAMFLLTSEASVDAIVAQYHRCYPTVIQLTDWLIDGTPEDLRIALPGVRIVQAVHVCDDTAVAEALAVATAVDALLLDSGDPRAAVPELGGTGRVHDWQISARIRERAGVPVYLAGGLTPENVDRAIRIVRPFGVDVCSGVRTDGALDRRKLSAFMAEVGAAAAGVEETFAAGDASRGS